MWSMRIATISWGYWQSHTILTAGNLPAVMAVQEDREIVYHSYVTVHSLYPLNCIYTLSSEYTFNYYLPQGYKLQRPLTIFWHFINFPRQHVKKVSMTLKRCVNVVATSPWSSLYVLKGWKRKQTYEEKKRRQRCVYKASNFNLLKNCILIYGATQWTCCM